MFIDHAEIYVKGGNGGDGCLSFRREKYIPKGGPDGGDGGDGGNVLAVGTPGVETLLDFAGRHHWKAQNGRPGAGKNMSGRSGEDLILNLPAGTLIYDRDTGVLLKDLTTFGENVPLAEGGKGGRGNARFASATHQVPREFEKGTLGRERWLRLELKLIADIAIVGLPNAGKSTLLSRISKAKPKIGAYPFTTLHPNLGVAELPGLRRLILADVPGLIEGAHEGAGLGDEFLRHIERTRVILHVVDVGSEHHEIPPAAAYRAIRGELTKYSAALAEKPEIIAGAKIDLTDGEAGAVALAEAIGMDVLPVSAVSSIGLAPLLERLWTEVRDRAAAEEQAEATPGPDAPTLETT